ncbi:MAG: glycosyltransferase [Aggregatilineales bacterium]
MLSDLSVNVPTLHENNLQSSIVKPVLLLEVDIARPIPSVLFIDLSSGQHYQNGLLLVRMYDQPIGMIELETHDFQIEPNQVASIIWDALAEEINYWRGEFDLPGVDQLTAFGLPRSVVPPQHLRERTLIKESATMISVIVCTHNRPDKLVRCLKALEMLDYTGFEVIVVDSAPTDDITHKLINSMFPDVYYIKEDDAGLSKARNRALEVAIGDIIAFTDDDALVDRNWLLEIMRGFRAGSDVTCVTGLTLPAELETPSQVWFQRHRGRKTHFLRRIFNVTENPVYTPLHISFFGAGMNMAFKKSFLDEIGGFDPALGMGSLTHSGEDVAAYFEVVARGHQIAYEPGAIVYHDHRETHEELRDQIYGYSVGLAACITRIMVTNPNYLRHLPRYLLSGVRYTAKKSARYPLQFRLLELKGALYGPFAYFLSRRKMAKTA